MLAIEDASYYVPENYVAIDDACEWLGVTPQQAKIYKRVFGLNVFPVAENESVGSLMKRAISTLSTLNKDTARSIKLIIHAHTAQVLCPFGTSIVSEIKKEWGFQDALYFGTSLSNCASVFNAFEIAETLFSSLEENAKALILIGDVTFTKSLRLVTNVSVTGDAAAAIIVSKNGCSNRLIALSAVCHGRYAKGLWLEEGERIHFEANYNQLLIKAIEQTLLKANIKMRDISLILPHNVNMHFWRKFSSEINMDPAKIYTHNIMKYAHCFGSDVIINLVDALKDNVLKKGDYYLMVTTGLGVTLAVALFQH